MSFKKLRREIFSTIDKHREELAAWQSAANGALAAQSAVAALASSQADEAAVKIEDLTVRAKELSDWLQVLLTNRTELRTHALEIALTLERRQLAYSKQEDMGGFVHIANQQLAGILTVLPMILDLPAHETLSLVRQMAADSTVVGKDDQ